MLVPPLKGLSLSKAVKELRDTPWGELGVIFAVIRAALPDREARRAYSAGAAMILAWPDDAPQMADLVAQALGVEMTRSRVTDLDRALARAVRARIKRTSSVPSSTRVACRGGMVYLAGEVEGIWQRQALESLVIRIPGVRGVSTTGLRVPTTGVSDRAVLAAVRRVLDDTDHLADEAILVSVDTGQVVLAGSTRTRREMDDLVQAISELRGVRGIENNLVVSPKQQERDGKVASRISGVLRWLFHDEQIQAKVFSGNVVLSGTVSRLVIKQGAEKIVSNDPAITRVINKLKVG